jgi:hypothetical protein
MVVKKNLKELYKALGGKRYVDPSLGMPRVQRKIRYGVDRPQLLLED